MAGNDTMDYQKEINAPGKSNDKWTDALMEERAKSVGPASKASDGKGCDKTCTPDGAKVVG
jgi:hypothetical protein